MSAKADQLQYEGGENLYAYVEGRPTKFLDPSGLEPQDLSEDDICIEVWEDKEGEHVTDCGGLQSPDVDPIDYIPGSRFCKFAKKGKYQKPKNPNKRSGKQDIPPRNGTRERNVKHPDAEEHSRRPKGGFSTKKSGVNR